MTSNGKFEVIRLSTHIGAEIRGLDISKPIDESLVAELNELWLEYIVLLFRDQKLKCQPKQDSYHS